MEYLVKVNKSTVEPKRCLILDVRTSSLEADLRVPGNRDEFLFLQVKGVSTELISPRLNVFQEFQCSERKRYCHDIWWWWCN